MTLQSAVKKCGITVAMVMTTACVRHGKPTYYQSYCAIYNHDGDYVRRYPGYLCQFLPDGRLVLARHSKSDSTIALYDRDMNEIWKVHRTIHHQLNLSRDKKRVLVLTDEMRMERGQSVRYDVIEILNLEDGKSLARWSVADHLQELGYLIGHPLPKYFRHDRNEIRPEKYEYSHINSFEEIPANPDAAKNPAFAAGNYLINTNTAGLILILDAKLKRILWAYREFDDHDADILKNGHLIYFDNQTPDYRIGNSAPITTLREVDPLTDKIIWSRQVEPFSDILGGVQILHNKHILYTTTREDVTAKGWGQPYGSEAWEIDRHGKVYWHFALPKDPVHPRGQAIQQLKQVDLGAFLRLNRGP